MKDKANLMNPFPGLRSFRSDEDYLFFGREEQTQELMARLERNRFIAVVGTSGRGKSSLVRCGLLSRLQGGGMVGAGAHWEIAVMHPGGDPLRHLAAALLETGLHDAAQEDAVPHLLATLRRSQFGLIEAVRQAKLPAKTNFLLVVDQFEEIFRFDEAGRAESEVANDFIAMLREASAQTEVPIYVVTTMRSDFIGDCSRFEGLAEAVNRGEYLIPGLTRDQFKAAIEGPIRVAGGQIAPRLLQRLLNDLGEEQDQLPCLQHALMRTWRVWQGRADAPALDLEDYAQVGKMSQALSVHADEVFSGFAPDRQRALCAAMFKALTVEGSEKRGIRRPRRLQTLCGILGVDAAELTPIIDAFRHPEVSFLMPPADVPLRDTTVIDLSHESLMRVWTRLREWVDDEAKSVGIFRRLSESAVLWRQGKSGFYRDPELSIARAWVENSRPNPVWAEQYDGNFEVAMAFLQASSDAAQEEVRAQEAARQRELAQARALAEAERARAEEQTRFAGRLKWLLRGVGAVALVALAAMAFALVARREAQQNAARARQSEAKAEAAGVLVDTARGNAEKLLSFLLEDFYEELEPTGRLETVGKLAREAVAYFDQLPPELRSPTTRRNRAIALMRSGQAGVNSGKADAGDAELKAAVAELEAMYQGGDRAEATVVALCAALRIDARTRGGTSANATVENDRAFRASRARCVSLLRPLVTSGKGSQAARLELAAQLSIWGFYLRSQPNPDSGMEESLAYLAEARELMAAAGALSGSNLRLMAEYARTTSMFALASRRVDEAEAARLWTESIALAEKVLAQQPGNHQALLARGISYHNLGRISSDRNEPTEAHRRMAVALEGFDLAIRADPSSAQPRNFRSMARREFAHLLLQEGKVAEALTILRAELERTKGSPNATSGGNGPYWRELIDLEEACGNWDSAQTIAAEYDRRLRDDQRDNRARIGRPAMATAVTLWHRGDYPKALDAAKEALGQAESLLADSENNRNFRSGAALTLQEALLQLGRGNIMLANWVGAEAHLRRLLAREFRATGSNSIATQEAIQTQAPDWLAVALARQGRLSEAAEVLTRHPDSDRRAGYAKGDHRLHLRWHLARRHYALALTQSDDAAGREQRSADLRQAKALLDESTEEARQLSEERLLRRLIDEELARLGLK